MDEKPDWRFPSSDGAKNRLWSAHRGSRTAPMQAWYWADGFRAEDASEAFLAGLRDAFWSPGKVRVVENADVVLERGSGPEDATFVRINMPDRFVPSFSSGGKTFAAIRVLSDAMVDFSVMTGDGKTPSVRVPMRSVRTEFRPGAADDLPVPSNLLRTARAQAEVAPPVRPPERLRPSSPTLVPPFGSDRSVGAPDPTDAPAVSVAIASPDDPTADHEPPRRAVDGRVAVSVRRRVWMPVPPAVPEHVSGPSDRGVAAVDHRVAPPPPRAAVPPTKSVLDDDPPPVPPLPVGILLAFVAGIALIFVATAYALL